MCLLIGIPIGVFALLFGAFTIYSFYEYPASKAQAFTTLVDLEIPDTQVAGDDGKPRTLARFQPHAPDKRIRVSLNLNAPYELPAKIPGKAIFEPSVKLQIVRESNEGVIRQTTQIDWQHVPRFAPTNKKGMWKAIPSKMELEFDPGGTDSYRVELATPTEGFRTYHLKVEQQGI